MTINNRLDDATFSTIIENTPLVSVDIVVERPDGRVLLGRRTNEPARDTWFVYGGRIRKDERIAQAIRRITDYELGQTLDPGEGEFLGVFEHLYDTNVFGKETFGTHYVVLAYKFFVEDALAVKPDSQHDTHRWWSVEDLQASPDVHPNTKAYYTD